MNEIRTAPKRWVVKLGTGILSDSRSQIDLAQIEQLTAQVVELRRRGHEVLVVSSGAVGCGMGLLGLSKRPTAVAELQACAALGQPRLMRLYDEAFSRAGLRVAQVLLTYLDLDSRSLYGNIQRSVEHLLSHKNVVPIFNENDVVAYDELVGARFGDNDQLSPRSPFSPAPSGSSSSPTSAASPPIPTAPAASSAKCGKSTPRSKSSPAAPRANAPSAA